MDDDTLAIRLLHDVRQVFTDETLGSAALVRRLVGLEDRPWADWAGGRPITQARVARLLRPFGIHADGLGDSRGEPDTAGSTSETAVGHDTHEARSGVPPLAKETGPTGTGDEGQRDDPAL